MDADIVCHENSWACSQIVLVVYLLTVITKLFSGN